MAYDVGICGGGLAGLTLALQLKGRLPDASVVVFERSRRPLPAACHKVGESTVEIGGRYLGFTLGFHDYLRDAHFIKNGLRFYAGAPGAPIAARTEMGPRESPTVPAYQIDRGTLEMDLRDRCGEAGVELREGWGVRDITLGAPHIIRAVQTRSNADAEEVEVRWLIDATGRRRMLVKKLGLHEDLRAQASSAWFRVAERVKIDDLVPRDEREWHDRDVDGNRWLSTCHLCGTGYWLWIIALRSGHTSIGVVAENGVHEFTGYSTEEGIRQWLEIHEPALSARLEGVAFADFVAMKDFRYGASRVLSPDRWACVGEAGLFVDPLYSPGTDLIALANTFTSEAIASDLEGAFDPARVEGFDTFYREWAQLLDRTMILGSNTMGAPEVLAAKLHWDFFYYWAFMCPYFFRRCWEPEGHERFRSMLARYAALNERAQTALQAWTEIAPADPSLSFVGLPAIATTLSDLHLALHEEMDVEATYAAMERSLEWGEEIVEELVLRGLRRAGPENAASFVRAVGVERPPAERRLDADEASPRRRRKLLGKAVRDMERSIGKNAAAGGPSLRELWALGAHQP